MRVLAVGAHPDDVELGCGGTLLRHHERRDEITVLVMTGGERGVYDARSRRNEQQYAAALTGATLIWGGFADGAVPPGPEAIAVVDRAVARSGAEILYTHAPDDSHQDHIATSSVCLAAARRVPTVLYYETPSTLEFMPTVFIDLDDVMDRKISLVRAHLSQVLRNGPVDLDALVAQARFRGSQSRTQHAEAFRPARFLWDLVSAPEHVPARGAGAGTGTHRPGRRAPGHQRGRRLAEPMNAAPGSPWTLLGMAGIFLIAVGVFGADVVCLTIVSGLAVLFIVFLLRHMAFACSAMSTARGDMRSLGSFDYGYRPRVSVLVPCRNEELVLEGLVKCLLAFDYPADLLEIMVVNDGSDDATASILDELARRDSRVRAIHRPPGAPGGKSGALNRGARRRDRRRHRRLRRRPQARAPTCCAASFGISPTRGPPRCRDAASSATRTSRSSRRRSRSTTTAATS